MTDQQRFVQRLAARLIVAAGLAVGASTLPSAQSGCYTCGGDPNGGDQGSCFNGAHLDGFKGSPGCVPGTGGCSMSGDCCVGSGCGGGGGSISA